MNESERRCLVALKSIVEQLFNKAAAYSTPSAENNRAFRELQQAFAALDVGGA